MATESTNEQLLLYPETVSRRRLPLNFIQENLPLFDGELERVIPQTILLQFLDVQISPDGILFKGFEMLPQSFAFPANLAKWKLRSRVEFFVKSHLFRHKRDVPELLWVTDDWSKGYFHWLTDVLSRLYVLKDRLHEFPLMLPHGFAELEFVRSTLRCFNLQSVEFMQANEVVKCRRLLMPSHTAPSGHYNEQIIRGVREMLVSSYGDSQGEQRQRIYISRRRAPKRRIANEEAVGEVLKDFGFQTICAEDLSFEEQVKVCSRASCLVSNHGAGLTNMLFIPEGARVLELRHCTDDINNCYFTLASALNLEYYYQTCEPAAANEDPHLADLIVDVGQLRKNLGLLLERNS